MLILVVDDDPKIASHVRLALAGSGFGAESVASGESALDRIRAGGVDAVILDIMLEGLDGLSVVRQLRAEGIRTPVLLLSARGAVDERVAGLEAGADDYLPKPFAVEELVARLRAILRRNLEAQVSRLQVGDLVLDPVTRVASRGARKVELTNREFRLLEYLMRCRGQACTRSMILERVWDYHFDPGTNIVEVYVRRVREKIERPGEEKLLQSVRGVGYMFREP